MQRRWLVITVLLTSFAAAQTTPAAAQKPAAKPQQQGPAKASAAKPASPATGAEVPEAAPVITLQGVCDAKAATPADCKTVVTRAQFEGIVSAVGSGRAGTPAQMPPGQKRELATRYSQLLAVATDAEKSGIQNAPETQQLIKFFRMQALVQAYTRQLQKKLQPTPAEVQSFYNANASKLEQASLERIAIPKTPAPEGKPADDAAGKATADKFRARAVAGEPFDKLQKEAMQGSTFPVPDTKVTVQKGALPPTQEAVFNLKPGEVSQVFSEPAGYFIFKMVSKQPIPLDQVKSEIEQQLLQQKMQSALEAMLKPVKPVLNEKYFGPPPAPQAQPAGTELTPNAAPAPQAPAQPAQSAPPEKPKSEAPPK